ncbi:MAG: NAD(P)-dependent oxidoreductase [Eubacteriales bacterium]|nr:NAD(P)-dependent oxidoreductase [Eubacteriales bacterium]
MARLLVTGWVPEDIIGPYREHFEEVFVPDEKKVNFTVEEVEREIERFDMLFTISAFRCTKELLERTKKLKAVCNLGVGYDNIDVDACIKKGVAVINTPQAVCQPTAEYTVALMMSICRGTLLYDQEVRETKRTASVCFFDRDMMLYGKTLGILGFGRIGQAVARKAKGLGMNIIYFDPFRNEKAEAELQAEYRSFDEVLENADVVSCHMPYTPENHHILNKEAFEKMKRTAYFINVARGPIMDEQALIEALKNKVIRGAATDVYEGEPNIGDEITKLKNIVLSPHIGSNVYEARRNMAQEALDGAIMVLNGKKPHNLVNPEVMQ